MPAVGLETRGADDLAKLARRLKEVGDKGLRRELYRGMQRATKPMKAAGRRAALADFPQRGGLNVRIARSRMSTKTRTAGKSLGVAIVVSSPLDLKAIERGRVRHPVFGNRKVWVTQDVKPHVITGAFAADEPQARREILAAIGDVARKLEAHL